MDEITLDLGGSVYRFRPMPGSLYLAILRGEADDERMAGALDEFCVAHPHGDSSLVDVLSIGALRRIAREWIRASTEDPFPPADGPR